MVTLIGSNSSDPDGNVAKYAWVQTAGTPVTLSSAAAATATFTAPAAIAGASAASPATALTFQLTVTDNGGLTATDTCIVNVTPATAPTNQPPVASAGVDQIADSGATVTLDGSGSKRPRWQYSLIPVAADSGVACDSLEHNGHESQLHDTGCRCGCGDEPNIPCSSPYLSVNRDG